jgi:2-keto-4-pentenoate hydratase/2-oxohepta-3-ene-1,7-dioic acid hydratase in catechol pathway
MKLASFRTPAGDRLSGEVRDDRVVAFDDGASVRDRLASGDLGSASGPDFALEEVELLAPLVPRVIFGIGLNYLAHAREQNAEPPEVPIVFMKLPSSAAAPGAPVRIPDVVKRADPAGVRPCVLGADGAGGG